MRLLVATIAAAALVGLGACASTGSGSGTQSREARLAQYKACSAKYPPEQVAAKCGQYLK